MIDCTKELPDDKSVSEEFGRFIFPRFLVAITASEMSSDKIKINDDQISYHVVVNDYSK